MLKYTLDTGHSNLRSRTCQLLNINTTMFIHNCFVKNSIIITNNKTLLFVSIIVKYYTDAGNLFVELLVRWNSPCSNEGSTLSRSTFNFTVPYLSALAILMLISGAVVLYLVSVRYLIMAWGVNKFARKLIRPHTVPNNEVLDLLSRVPDDEDLVCSSL